MREIGAFEQVIMLALARCGGEGDGVRVRAEIERCTGRAVAPGAVFTAMDRLEGRGLVSSRMGEKQRVRGGKRRKLYSLEVEGAAALAAAHREYLSLADGVMPTLVEILPARRRRRPAVTRSPALG